MRILTVSTLVLFAVIFARQSFAAEELNLAALQQEMALEHEITPHSPLSFYNNSYAWLVINSSQYRQALIEKNCVNGKMARTIAAYMPQTNGKKAKSYMKEKGSSCESIARL